jgi:hypothetical protein
VDGSGGCGRWETRLWCHEVGCLCSAIGARLDWEILTTREGFTKTDAGTMKAHALSRRYSSATLSTRSIGDSRKQSLPPGTDRFIYSTKKKKKSGHSSRPAPTCARQLRKTTAGPRIGSAPGPSQQTRVFHHRNNYCNGAAALSARAIHLPDRRAFKAAVIS